MTPEEKATLKEDIMAKVEECLSNEEYTSKEAILDKVIEDLEVLKGDEDMGGLGEEADEGMQLPEEDDSDSDGE